MYIANSPRGSLCRTIMNVKWHCCGCVTGVSWQWCLCGGCVLVCGGHVVVVWCLVLVVLSLCHGYVGLYWGYVVGVSWLCARFCGSVVAVAWLYVVEKLASVACGVWTVWLHRLLPTFPGQTFKVRSCIKTTAIICIVFRFKAQLLVKWYRENI